MSAYDSIPFLRSRIAMFLKSGAGDSSARALLEDATELLMLAERGVLYWQQRAEQAEALNQAEQDDGK